MVDQVREVDKPYYIHYTGAYYETVKAAINAATPIDNEVYAYCMGRNNPDGDYVEEWRRHERLAAARTGYNYAWTLYD
jgi:sarcosine oxidase delta subunit